MKNWKKSGAVIAVGLVVMGGAAALVLNALNSNIALSVTSRGVVAGKGAVVQGRLGPDVGFTASEVLATHDENYMPPEAEHALEQARKSAEAARP